MIGIYKITSPSNRVYIGQSIDIERRWKSHKGSKHQNRLYSSFKKHGVENHTFEVLEECEADLLNERERFYQDKFNVLGPKGLNSKLTPTDDKVSLVSVESRQKMSKSQKLYNANLSEEKRLELNLKNSQSNKGRAKTKEHQDKITEGIRNRVLSKEAKKNIIDSSSVKVIDTNTGVTYDSIKLAAESISMKDYCLRWRLRGYVKNNTNLKLLSDV